MSKPHTPDLGSDFPDFSQKPETTIGVNPVDTTAVRAPLGEAAVGDATDELYELHELHAALAEQPQSAPHTENIEQLPHSKEPVVREYDKTSLSDVVMDGTVKKKLPDELTYEQFVGNAATGNTNTEEAPATPADKPERHSVRKWLTVSLVGLVAAAGAGVTAYFIGKSNGSDTENADATPPAATAGSLGVDAPKTSSISTAEGTATIQAQPTAEAQSPAEAFLAKGVAAGTGGIDIDSNLQPGGEQFVPYKIRDKEYRAFNLPDPATASAQQIAAHELTLMGAYLSASSEDDASNLLKTMDNPTPKNVFTNSMQQLRAEKQATARTDPNGAMVVTFGGNPKNPPVFTKSSSVNANGDTITTVTLTSGELYMQSAYVAPIDDVDRVFKAPYSAQLTVPVTQLSIVAQKSPTPNDGWGEFDASTAFMTGSENMANTQN